MLKIASPAAVGLDPSRWQRALDLAEGWCARDDVPGIGLIVGRSEKTTGVQLFGRQHVDPASPPLRDDAIFLVASLTKPIVATGILLLVERGKLLLSDRVADYLPEFGRTGKYGITIRHLLTHTSGLPDMLPNNLQLRRAHAPFETFIEDICTAETAFAAGRGTQYQSMGFALLGEIIHRVTGKQRGAFLREALFEPLEMHDTVLGAPEEWFVGTEPTVERIAEIRLTKDQDAGENWHWNSPYWRRFGAPWGGLLTTPADLARFSQMMLNDGRAGETQLLAKATVEAATSNQLNSFSELPEGDRRCRPWGFGWRLRWAAESASFGDLLGPTAYGHWGSTGTLLWIDPARDAFAVILTTQPQEPRGRYLAALSNTIVAALG
jgi:CubicO group peptidase (beta-lactamase class C family)